MAIHRFYLGIHDDRRGQVILDDGDSLFLQGHDEVE
jgi:hypothetical protein